MIRRVVKTYPEDEVKAFIAYLFDPSVQEEITYQEKQRYSQMLDQLQKGIEGDLGVEVGSVCNEEVKRLLAKALDMKRHAFLRCSLRNRSKWLGVDPNAGQSVLMELPRRAKISNWQWWSSDAVFSVDAKAPAPAWASATMNYATPKSMSGTQLFKSIMQIMVSKPPENMSGSTLGLGWLFLYQVLTGSIKLKVGGNDDSVTMARLLWHYYGDAHQRSLWSSVLSILTLHPGLCELLPKFKDNRPRKTQTIMGKSNDQHPVCPLDELMKGLVPMLQSAVSSVKLPDLASPPFVPLLHPSEQQRTVAVKWTLCDDWAKRRPKITDFMCTTRKLVSPNLTLLCASEPHEHNQKLQKLLAVSATDLAVFATLPLACLGLSTYIKDSENKQVSRSFVMPFDVSKHPEASAPVCKQMISRLETDLKNHEDILNKTNKQILTVDMLSYDVEARLKLDFLDKLEQSALTQREKDLEFVQCAFSALERWSNFVELGASADNKDSRSASVQFYLSRYAGTEARLSVEFVVALLTCGHSVEDLQKVIALALAFLNSYE